MARFPKFNRVKLPKIRWDVLKEEYDEELDALDALGRLGEGDRSNYPNVIPTDIRQILSDNAIKDFLAEEDRRFLSAINSNVKGV